MPIAFPSSSENQIVPSGATPIPVAPLPDGTGVNETSPFVVIRPIDPS